MAIFGYYTDGWHSGPVSGSASSGPTSDWELDMVPMVEAYSMLSEFWRVVSEGSLVSTGIYQIQTRDPSTGIDNLPDTVGGLGVGNQANPIIAHNVVRVTFAAATEDQGGARGFDQTFGAGVNQLWLWDTD